MLIRREAANISPDDVQVGPSPASKRVQVIREDDPVENLDIAELSPLDVDGCADQVRTSLIELLHRHPAEGDVGRNVLRRVDVAVDDPPNVRVGVTREKERRHPERRLAEEGDDDRDRRATNTQRLWPSSHRPTWRLVRAASGPRDV